MTWRFGNDSLDYEGVPLLRMKGVFYSHRIWNGSKGNRMALTIFIPLLIKVISRYYT
jgi:hypothetical protein